MTQNKTSDVTKHSIAHKICGKDINMSFTKCHKTKGANNVLCKNSEKCRIEEKTSEQVEYIESSIKENIFLNACPGSGKTEVVGVKAAYEMSKWEKPFAGMAILTFTNNATDVIFSRVRQFTGMSTIPYPHFVGTFDSWLQGYIVQPFAHKVTGYKDENGDTSITLIEENCKSAFLIPYKIEYTKGTNEKYQINEVSFSPRNKSVIFYNDEINNVVKKIAELDSSVLQEIKSKKQLFKKQGWATYYDIDKIAQDVLKDENIIKQLCQRFPFIIIDEAQDLSEMQFMLLSSMHKYGVIIHYVGDINQSIYKFRGSDPELIINHINKNKVTVMSLTINHRSNQSIVNLHSKLIDLHGQNISSSAGYGFDKSCIIHKYSKSKLNMLPEQFSHYVADINSNIKDNKNIISLDRSAIIVRGRRKIRAVSGQSNVKMTYQVCLAKAIYLYVIYGKSHLEEALNLLGSFFDQYYFKSNIVTLKKEYYRPKDYFKSTSEWRLFLYDLLQDISKIKGKLKKKGKEKEIIDFSQTWTDWMTLIKKFTIKTCSDNYKYSIIALIDNAIANTDFFESKEIGFLRKSKLTNMQIPRVNKSSKVIDIFKDNSEMCKIVRIDTIHGVKGETLDAVMLVSNERKKHGGCYKEWIKDKNSEAARMAYVASSRPKHLLVWAIPDSANNNDLEKLKEIGFSILNSPNPENNNV